MLVARMVSFGLDEPQIAYCMGIPEGDVRLHYKNELEHGLALVVAKVGNSLIRQARKGNVNAMSLFLKARGRWVEPTKVEVTGKDGGPVEIAVRQQRMATIRQLLQAATERPKPEQAAPLTARKTAVSRGTQGQDGKPGSKPKPPTPGAVH